MYSCIYQVNSDRTGVVSWQSNSQLRTRYCHLMWFLVWCCLDNEIEILDWLLMAALLLFGRDQYHVGVCFFLNWCGLTYDSYDMICLFCDDYLTVTTMVLPLMVRSNHRSATKERLQRRGSQMPLSQGLFRP